VRLWYSVIIALIVSVYVALPQSRGLLLSVLGAVGVGAIELGIRKFRPERAGGWRCLQLAVALLALGDTVFAIADYASPTAIPYPTLSNVLYLAMYPALTIALIWLGRSASRYRDDTTMLDTIILTLAGGLIVWIVLVRPYLLTADLSAVDRLITIAAWLGYVTVLAASVRVLRSRRRSRAAALLAIAVFAFLVAELVYGYELVQDSLIGSRPIDLGYIAFTALCGAAALQPSMRDIPAPGGARQTLGRWRVTMIIVALSLGPAVLLLEASRKVVRPGVSIALIGGLVGVLMLFRLRMTGRAYQRRTAREHASRAASEAMVAARKPQEVIAGIRSALHPLVHDHAAIEVELSPSIDDVPHGTVTSSDQADGGILALPLDGSDAALVFAAPVDDLDDLNGLLRSLADQAAVALERIHLAEAAAAAERDRHFRALVLASTEVILISRDGRIEYATPSAQALFGRDVVGERVDDIVHPHRPVELRPTQADVADGDSAQSDLADSTEATIQRPDAERTVVVHQRDLTDEPTVRGVVTTMRDVTAERALQRDLAYRASHDELTGLANVRAWEEGLTTEGDNPHGPGNGIAVIAIDLDHFKTINDRYGHAAGDRVLAEVARRIRERLRPGDLAARVGGDEFGALLRRLRTVDDARTLAQQLVESLARPAVIDSMTLDCGASVGLSYSEGAEPAHMLVRHADTALYAAKDQGRGRWTEYNASAAHPSSHPTAAHPDVR
jgi:diguanylate cyclase (GGDEF)-like protein/PAS domain S-box-containing protein